MATRVILGPNMLRAVHDRELFCAADAAALVRLLHATSQFQDPTTNDQAFMRESSERWGGTLRYNTPEHFIEDLRSAGLIELLKHEYREADERDIHNQSQREKGGSGKTIVIPGDGDPRPRCGVPMQIREHDGVGEKQLRQPYYYTRWFYCMNKNCKTETVTRERYKVIKRRHAAR